MFGELVVTIHEARNLPKNEGGMLLSKRFTPYVKLSTSPQSQNNTETQSLVTPFGSSGSANPRFNSSLTLRPTHFDATSTITVDVMSSLRFGADAVVGSVQIPVDESIFKAGKKGTLFAWYTLSTPDDEFGGEVSCSFSFKVMSVPSPVRTKPVAVIRPWWATAGGLYCGTKDAWNLALRSERYYISPVATFIDKKVADIVEKRSKTRNEVDSWFQERLEAFDESIDMIIPRVWEKVPMKQQMNVDIPLTCSHELVAAPKTLFPIEATETAEEPELVVVDNYVEIMTPEKEKKKNKKKFSGGALLSSYPSLLPSSANAWKERTESYADPDSESTA